MVLAVRIPLAYPGMHSEGFLRHVVHLHEPAPECHSLRLKQEQSKGLESQPCFRMNFGSSSLKSPKTCLPPESLSHWHDIHLSPGSPR